MAGHDSEREVGVHSWSREELAILFSKKAEGKAGGGVEGQGEEGVLRSTYSNISQG